MRLTKYLIAVTAATAVSVPATDAHAQAPTCRGLTATIVGTAGPNRLTGTAARDIIFAGGGNDVIDARGGNDVVCGGSGDDRLVGGSGTDTLDAGLGNDACVSGETRISCESGVQTSFMPTRHGFPFVNHFTALPSLLTPFGWFNGVDYGLCGGMAFAALDNWRFDENAPGMSDQVFTYLWARLVDSLTLDGAFNLERFNTLQNMSNTQLANTTNTEVGAIRAQLDSRPTPVGVIIPAAGQPIWANHQVLAIGWFTRNGTTVLKVYDPNAPDVISYIDVAARTLSSPTNGTVNIRGVFHERYSEATTPW